MHLHFGFITRIIHSWKRTRVHLETPIPHNFLWFDLYSFFFVNLTFLCILTLSILLKLQVLASSLKRKVPLRKGGDHFGGILYPTMSLTLVSLVHQNLSLSLSVKLFIYILVKLKLAFVSKCSLSHVYGADYPNCCVNYMIAIILVWKDRIDDNMVEYFLSNYRFA